MAESRNRYLDYLVYLFARLGVMFVQMFPLRFNYFCARLTGDVLYRFVHSHRRRALGHLRRSFPHWDEEQYQRVARASARNISYLAMEIMLATRLIRVERRPQYFRLTDMADTIRMLIQRKTGLILVTGHFGNWEVAGYMTGSIGLPTVTIARHIKNQYMNRYITSLRENAGQRIVDKTGAGRAISEALERKEAVSVVCDQDAGWKAVFVDYFGRKASTFKSIGLMAMLHKAPIAVLYCRRLDEPYHFEVCTHRIIYPHEWVDKDDPLQWITQEYTSALEEVVRTDPQQYFWVHRRWKHRPRGEARNPDGIA